MTQIELRDKRGLYLEGLPAFGTKEGLFVCLDGFVRFGLC